MPKPNRGTTLIELALAVTILAVLAGIVVPRVFYLADAAAVRQEAARLAVALDAARWAAVRLGSNASLTLAPDGWEVLVVRGADSLVAWRAVGSASAGVTLTGAGAPIVFSNAAVAVGAANRTLTLGRRLALRRLVISRLGRVMD